MIPRRFFWLLDVLILGLAFLGAYALVPGLQTLFAPGGLLHSSWLDQLASPALWNGVLPPHLDLLWMLLIMAPAVLIALAFLGVHGSLLGLSRTRIIIASVLAPLIGLGLIALVLFALKKSDWSRLFVFSFMALSVAGLGGYRLILRHYFQRRQAAGYYAKNVLLIGLTPAIEWMTCYFADHVSPTAYKLIGYLSVHPDQPLPSPQCNGNGNNLSHLTRVSALGHVEDLGYLLIRQPVHEVIVVQPPSGGEWIQQVIQVCDYLGVLLRIVPEALLVAERRRLKTLYPFTALNLPAVVLAPPYWDSDALFLKRVFDIILSGVLLVLLAPLFLAIAVAIKITTPDLPVFYRWHVVGQNGVEFTGYKFTTMVRDADVRKADLIAQNEMNGPVFKMKDDPRVTPFGKYLRKFSLNELPQLWSVLKGDMSLVGPRPAFRYELERYEFWHKRKLSIRPGITCLWQIRGRNKIVDFDDWVRMDLEYIDNWSFWLDVKILFRTAWVVLAGTGS